MCCVDGDMSVLGYDAVSLGECLSKFRPSAAIRLTTRRHIPENCQICSCGDDAETLRNIVLVFQDEASWLHAGAVGYECDVGL